jgi:hypothetical protein
LGWLAGGYFFLPLGPLPPLGLAGACLPASGFFGACLVAFMAFLLVYVGLDTLTV